MFNFRKTIKKYWFPILVLFIIILSAVIWLPKYGAWTGATDVEYQVIAQNMLEGKGYSLDEEKTMKREPAYPTFLFLNYKIFGVNSNLIRFEQLIFLFLICFLTYKLSKEFFNEAVAKIATLAIAIHPLFIIYVTDRVSEILATFLILLFCFVLLKSVGRENLLFSFLSGSILGLLVLTKSIFIFIPIFAVIFYLFKGGNKKLVKATLFFLAFVIFVSPWFLRNYTYFDTWSIAERGGLITYMHTLKTKLYGQDLKDYLVSSFLSQYFVRLENPSFKIADINKTPVNEEIDELLGEGYSRREIDILFAEKAKESWKQHPIKNFLLGFTQLSRANSPTVPKDSIMYVYAVPDSLFMKFARGAVLVFIRLFWLIVLLLMVYGVYKTIRLKKYYLLPLIFLIVYLNGLLSLFDTAPRHIFPIYPLYFIFFAFGLSFLLSPDPGGRGKNL
ncbi:ArnT family glycosyltransferase [Patescibacteria group bacterium]